MKIEKITYGPWQNAYRCVLEAAGAEPVELIAVADIGPRILSLRLGDGENILFQNQQGDMGRGDWKIWGGHRFWISPETEDTYLPANEPCEAHMAEDELILSAPKNHLGLQKSLIIAPSRRPSEDDPSAKPADGFLISHILYNHGPMLAMGAIWGLTCVVPKGKILVPWGEGSEDASDPQGWRTNMVRYWRRWAGTETNIESRQWQAKNACFLIEPTGETGKVGCFADNGVIALLRDDSTFIKAIEYSDMAPGTQFPDGGCNIEMYTCPSFLEMETLGPLVTIYPGSEVEHEEKWILTPDRFTPDQAEDIINLAHRE